jgi:iron complex outermembrane receptor protein
MTPFLPRYPLRPHYFLPALLFSLHGAVRADESAMPMVSVSASKQVQLLDRVPASVTVLDDEALRAAGARGLEHVGQLTPGLSFQPFGQAGVLSPVMRGMTANFFSFSSATLLLNDGVPVLMAQGFDDNLLGIDRIEVLRGPQGTLYGRNAEAGVINIYSSIPGNVPRSSVEVEAGSRNRRALRADLGRVLVADRLYASISGEKRRQDGFIANRHTGLKEDGRDSENLKLALRWTPDALTDAIVRYRHFSYDDGAALWTAPTAARATVQSGTPSWNHMRGSSVSLDVARQLAHGIKLRAITARSDVFDKAQQDTDFRPVDLLQIARDHHFRTTSQEVRLEGWLGTAQWLAGLYGDRDEHDLLNEQKLPMGLSRSAAKLGGNSTAAFTHWSVPLGGAWSLNGGARYERDKVRYGTPAGVRQDSAWSRLTPKLAVQYQAAPALLLYASASEGFRAGGYNVFAPSSRYTAFSPETVRALELGAKGWLAGKRLRYAAALYRMQVDDMQVQQMPSPGLVYLTNAASARSTGAEAELDYLLGGGWQLQAALALNRTRFGRFRDGTNNYDGQHNPFAPDRSGQVALRYDAGSGWHAQAALSGTGAIFLDAANRYRRNGYGLLNLNAGYRTGAWDVSAYVSNLADRRYDAVGYQNGIVSVVSPPREAGLRLRWSR